MKNYFFLTDNQIRDIFDNCRNLGICGAIFAAADWEYARIGSMATGIEIFSAVIFFVLVIVGIWLFFITQLQAFRKLREYGFNYSKLTLLNTIYNLVVIGLLTSIFVH